MQTTNSNHTTVSTLNNSAWDNRYIDRDLGLRLALEAKELALKNSNLLDYHFAQLIIAQYLFWKTNEGEHLITANQSLAYFEKEHIDLGISRANAICAGMYDQYGEYEKAMRHALNAVKASDSINDDSNKGDCYTLLGQIYSRIHDYGSAINALQTALDIRKNIKEEKAVASSLNLIARNYVLSKKYVEAKNYYEESLLLRQTIGDTGGIPWTYLGLASLYSEQKEWKLSLDFYTKAEQANQNKEKQFELLCLIGKGKICLNEANITDSITYLNEALVIAKSLKISSLESEAHQLLADAYEGNANLELALSHYKKYNELKQAILSNEKVNMLKNQQIAFSVEHAEKEAEIHRLKHVELKNAFDQIAIQHHELEEKSKEISDSINYAERIQRAMLPHLSAIEEHLPNSFVLFKPKDVVSGDFYWFNQVDDKLFFACVDCTGHGVPGAFMSMIGTALLNEIVLTKKILSPSAILSQLNINVFKALKQNTSQSRDGMDMAFCMIDKKANTVTYTGANRELLLIRDSKLIEYKPTKSAIGGFTDADKVFEETVIALQPNDVFYMSTDGYADQFGGDKCKKLMTKNFKELLLSICELPLSKQADILHSRFVDWKGNLEQVDDILVIGFKV